MPAAHVALTSNTRVQVKRTLEVAISDNWTGETHINQVVAQAKASALNRLHDILRQGARVIGTPGVTLVMVDGEAR